MNTATRGIVLVIAAVALGAIILARGFDDPDVSVAAGDDSPAATPTPADSGDTSTDGASTGDDASTDGASTGDDTSTDGASTGDDASTDGASTGDDASTDGASTGDDTSTADPGVPVEHPKSEVRVLVANDTVTGGLAGTIRDELTAQGYNGLTPTDSTTQGSGAPTAVYFAEGYEADAGIIAEILGAPETAVAALPAQPPVTDLNRANVLVVVGTDLVPAA